MVKLRRMSVVEKYILESKDLTLEAKKDLDDLKDYLGDDLFDDYMKIRDRISKDKNDFKDFSKLKKKDKKDIRDFIASFQSKSDKKKSAKAEGAEKIYDGEDWVVYRITTYPAAQLYGKGTRWCITGRYPGHEGKGEEYFNDYIENNDLDGGYYFFIDKKDPSRKFCALRYDGGSIHSIWNAEDSVLSDVDRDEAPFDLKDIADDLPNELGGDIMDYIEYESGENVNPEDLLIEELKKGRDSWNDDRIDRYIENLEGYEDAYGIEWDDLYKSLNDDAYIDGFKEILDRGDLPSISFIDEKCLSEKCFRALVDEVINVEGLIYRERYAKKLFKELVLNYGKRNYDYEIGKDLGALISLLNICPDDILEEVSFEDIGSELDDKVVCDKSFLETCLNKGLDKDSFFNELRYMTDNKKCMKIVRAAIEAGVKLNDKDVDNNGETNFAYILANLNPSVEDVKWMLTKGANPDIKDSEGDTAIEYTDDPKIKELLK